MFMLLDVIRRLVAYCATPTTCAQSAQSGLSPSILVRSQPDTSSSFKESS